MSANAETSTQRTSRVGKRPVPVPKGVTTTIQDGKIRVKGPKGELDYEIPTGVFVNKEDEQLLVTTAPLGNDGPRLQGLVRALIVSMVTGVTEGYTKILELHGTGYRAELKGNVLHCLLGFSHPVDYTVPQGIAVDIPKDSKGTVIVISGADKALVGQTAAKIRAFRPAEPYGGKGVRYRGERIREKAGKAGK